MFPSKVSAQAPNNGKKIETSVSGNTTTIIEKNGYQRTYTKTTDVLGNTISSTDPGGTITFEYNANGQQTKAIYAENIITTTYDEWGRKASFNDPANGTYEYEYDGFGNIKIEFSPKGSKRYNYKSNGLLDNIVEESNDGVATDKSYSFAYNQYWQITGKSGSSNGKTYTTLYGYYPDGRLWGSTEYIENRELRNWDTTYDSYGNVKTYKKEIISNGITTSAKIENVYSTWDGSLYQVKEQGTGKILWQLQSTNAKGQVLSAKLGAAQITNTYSTSGFISTAKHISPLSNIIDYYYMFDAIKNELVVRTNYIFGLNETFSYDNNNRLTSWTNPKNGQQSSNSYDDKGRITINDQIGAITYGTSGNVYRATKLNLNANGTTNYGIGGQNILLQNISYNENNDPIKIRGRQNDYAFEYGLSESRQVMSYGGKFESSQNARFTKIYSEDGSFEIIRNNQNGQEKHMIYIGGTPYESSIMYMKDMSSSTPSFYFLHKDYLGSIIGVTNEAGYAIERRHYDAWGNFTHFMIAGSLTNPGTYTGMFLTDRGYTSHEHLYGVQLIHMNGRLYDPLLRRFLNADENIQDPTNTQIYNKYGYVMNNPLMYNDPSGEFFLVPLIAAFVISAAQAVVVTTFMYMAQAIITGNGSNSGFLKSIFSAAVTGGLFGGYGNVFTSWQGAASFVLSQFLPEFSWRPTIFGQKFFVSPSFAFGQGVGIGASVSTTFRLGDFSLDASFGIMNYGSHAGSGTSGWEYRKSLMLGYDDGKTGFSLGTNWWSGLKGIEGESLNQRTGLIGFHSGDFRMKYENDGGIGIRHLRLGDRGDSYRTASLNLSVGDYSVGFNLFTGYRGRDNQEYEDRELKNDGVWKTGFRDDFNRKYPRGYVNETGEKYRLGALYFGYKNYRFGTNSEHVRHTIQDKAIHGLIGDAGFQNTSWDWKPYMQYQTINKFTSW